MRFLIILLSFFCFSSIKAGNDNYPVGTRAAGMGNAAVSSSDLWSIHHNQAGLAFLKEPVIGLHYENKYIVNELGLQSLAFAYPTGNAGVIGVNVSYFGYAKYNESKFGLAYAKAFGDHFSVGIMLDYLNTHIDEQYGSKGSAVGEIGIMAEPYENLIVGIHVFNISQTKIADYNNERIPTIFKAGIGYHFSEKAFVTAEAEKDIDYKPIFKAGVEYELLKNLFLRTGIISNPIQNTFGIGYSLKNFKADIAFSTHPVLGITPHISINYSFGKKCKTNASYTS